MTRQHPINRLSAYAVSEKYRGAVMRLARWDRDGDVDVAAALAQSRHRSLGPLDRRPELIMWYVTCRGDLGHVAIACAKHAIIRYATANAVAIDQALFDAAAGDVANCFATGDGAPADERAKQLGVRAAIYRPLRRAALEGLRLALESGLERFQQALTRDGSKRPRPYSGFKPSPKPEVRVEHQQTVVDPIDRIEALLAGDVIDTAGRADLVIASFEILSGRFPNFAPGTVDEILPNIYAGRIRGEAA